MAFGGNMLVSLAGKTWLEGVFNGSANAAFTCNDRLFMPQYNQTGKLSPFSLTTASIGRTLRFQH